MSKTHLFLNCKILLRFLLVIFITFFSANELCAKKYLDKTYYIVDSLKQEDISVYDQQILDSILPLYHKAKYDTTRLNLIDYLAEKTWGEKVWTKYNQLEYDLANTQLSKIDSTHELYYRYNSHLAKAINNFGFYKAERGAFVEANEFCNKAFLIAKGIKDTSGMGLYLEAMAVNFVSLGEIEKAIKYHKESLTLFEQINDKIGVAWVLNSIGEILYEQGNIQGALSNFNKALALSEEINDGVNIAQSLESIGIVYSEQSDFKIALDYFEKVLTMRQKIGDRVRVASVLNLIGDNYFYEAELKRENNEAVDAITSFYNQALIDYQKSLNISTEMLDENGKAASMYSIGSVYERQAEMLFKKNTRLDSVNAKRNKALEYYQKSLIIREEISDKLGVVATLIKLSRNYLENKEFEKAKKTAIKSYEKALELGFPNEIEASSTILWTINEKQGNFKEALKMYKISVTMRDSLQSEANEKATYKQQLKYDYEKKEEKLKLEEEKIKIKAAQEKKVRNTIIAGVSGGLILSFIFLIFLFNRIRVIRKQKGLIEKQASNLTEAYGNLNDLQQFKDGMTSMIVHDLKNPLNAMLGYAEEVQSINLKARIRNTSKMMLNYVLNILDVQKFEHSEVRVCLKTYPLVEITGVAIEQVEFLADEKNIKINNLIKRNYIVKVDKDLVERVLVNLLTNSIKYSPFKSEITISANAQLKQGEFLEITVKDEGQGIPKNMLGKIFDKFAQVEAKKSGTVKSTGLGLTFCKLAIEGHEGEIWAYSEINKGSEFHFTLPLENDAGELLQNVENKTEIITLSEEELKKLQPIKAELGKLDIMDTVEIIELLEQIRNWNNTAANKWANKVENACLAMDETDFQKLIFEI